MFDIQKGNIQSAERSSGRDSILEMWYNIRWMTVFAVLIFSSGLTMLYSTSGGVSGPKYFYSQLVWFGIGLVAIIVVFMIGYRKLAEYSDWLLLLIIVLLMLALLFDPIKGARRWIKIPLIVTTLTLQPSELAKIALALVVSKYVSGNLRTLSLVFNRRGIVPVGIVITVTCVMILAGHDLGTTTLCFLMSLAILFAGGLSLWYAIVPMVLVAFGSVYIYFCDPMRLARAVGFLDPEKYASGKGYQLWTGILAIGSGGWSGRGFMESRMKALYLPEAHTDFILAIVGEELGLIGMIVVLFLYAGFVYYAFKICLLTRSKLGKLLGFGLTMLIGFQAMINIGVVTGSLPTKGMPAPLMSYGGSSLLSVMIAVGLLISIGYEEINPDYSDPYTRKLKNILEKLPIIKRMFNHG